MEIIKEKDGEILNISLIGRLNTVTAPCLEQELKDSLSEIKILNFDFKDLEYISSAGLCVILATQKKMNKQGRMVINNVNKTIMNIFEMTGFINILTIK